MSWPLQRASTEWLLQHAVVGGLALTRLLTPRELPTGTTSLGDWLKDHTDRPTTSRRYYPQPWTQANWSIRGEPA